MVGEASRSLGIDPLDGLALRQRLIETIRHDQSDYAALGNWLVQTLPAGDEHALRERLERAVGAGAVFPRHGEAQAGVGGDDAS